MITPKHEMTYHLEQKQYRKASNKSACDNCKFCAIIPPGERLLCRYGPNFKTTAGMTCKEWKSKEMTA